MALTDKMRAAVFARDKGICAFSGRSLWILDEVTAFWQQDWPDHVKPVARGGKDAIENLVCASYFHNRKKANNGADNSYFFRGGRPTEDFFRVHVELTKEQGDRLARHAPLVENDWYFNRALSSLLVGLDQEWLEPDRKFVRGPRYWQGAAHTKLLAWRKAAGSLDAGSFVRRGLVRHPDAPDVRLMLSLADAEAKDIPEIYHDLKGHHEANSTSLREFSVALTPAQRRDALLRAEKRRGATEPLLALLRKNAQQLDNL